MNRHVNRRKVYCVLGLALALPATTGAGCNEYMDEFRAAASPSLRTGVDALVDGFVEGVFAVVEPDEEGEGNTNAPTGAP